MALQEVHVELAVLLQFGRHENAHGHDDEVRRSVLAERLGKTQEAAEGTMDTGVGTRKNGNKALQVLKWQDMDRQVLFPLMRCKATDELTSICTEGVLPGRCRVHRKLYSKSSCKAISPEWCVFIRELNKFHQSLLFSGHLEYKSYPSWYFPRHRQGHQKSLTLCSLEILQLKLLPSVVGAEPGICSRSQAVCFDREATTGSPSFAASQQSTLLLLYTT